MGIVYPECLNKDSQAGKLYTISRKEDPHRGIMIPIVQIDNSHMVKLIPAGGEDDFRTGIVYLVSLQYDSCEGKIVKRVRIDDFRGAEVVFGHGEGVYYYE